ncbi:DUF6087 family protein [Streptomyces sp. NPDC051644]|uniref:DUF6087 family protein n=1 Tax=Streptomyces sp. NPDC051644 TaxID=3365666 RepID=UPI0037B68CE5
MEDEPLDEWAPRREQRRPARGERRATPLGDQQHGTHVVPDAPRGIQEWDGDQWVPVGVANDLAAAADETGKGPPRRWTDSALRVLGAQVEDQVGVAISEGI